MKKLLLAALAISVTTIAGAQVQFGAKAGLNLANLHASDKEDGESTNMKASFHAGGFAYVPLVANFGLQPELQYSAQGSKLKEEGSSINYNINYLNIPVLFKYKDASGFFAEVGPQFGLLLNAKAKANDITADIKDRFKSTDISAALGIGYLSSMNIGIDARYNLGLTDISSSELGTSIKNNVIQVGLFYAFGGKKK